MKLRLVLRLLCVLAVFCVGLTGWAEERQILRYGGHGGGGNALQALRNYPVQQVADREGFILVTPNGTGGSGRDWWLSWNVGFGFGYARQQAVDDTGFLRALIGHLEKTLPVDPKRVYLTGISNGAMLCHWAAATNSDLIAGIAPVVGTLGGRDMDEQAMHVPPRPTRSVDVIMFNGSLDEDVPPEGGLQKKWGERRKFLLSAKEAARFWVEANGCNPTALVEKLKELQATRFTWSGGRKGTRVVLYMLHNQGHCWPGGTVARVQDDRPSRLIKAHEVLWQFWNQSARKP